MFNRRTNVALAGNLHIGDTSFANRTHGWYISEKKQ